MSETKISYIDYNGKFIELPVSETSITTDNYGGSITVTAPYKDCCNTFKESDWPKNRAINMFDKIINYKVYGKTTIVYFSDGTKETVVCSDGDNFDVEQGITMCVIKRMFGDSYKKSVRAIVKAKTLNEKELQKLEAANKEAKLREEIREKKNRENKLRMKARYEARLAAAIEEEKKKIKKRPLNS